MVKFTRQESALNCCSNNIGVSVSEPLPSQLNVNFVCLSVCMSWTGSILALNVDDSYLHDYAHVSERFEEFSSYFLR